MTASNLSLESDKPTTELRSREAEAIEPFATLSNKSLTSLDFSQRDNDFASSNTYDASYDEWVSDPFVQPFTWETFMGMDMDFNLDIQPPQQDHCPPNPTQMSSVEVCNEDTLLAEDFCHVEEIDYAAYECIRRFQREHERNGRRPFPSFKMIYTFVQLYFEYFDRYYPFVHPHMMNNDHTSWILLLAIATIGARYSAIDFAEQYAGDFQDLLSQAISQNLPADLETPTVSFVQSMLLMTVCLTFGGSTAYLNRLARDKNVILTLFDSLPQRQAALLPSANIEETWRNWLVQETQDRLALCIMRFELYQLLFFEFRILPQSKSLLNRLPCDESLWRCRSAKEWHIRWANGQGAKHTLANAMSADDKSQTADSLHGPNIEIFVLALYAEERTATEQLVFSPLLHGAKPLVNKMTANVDEFFDVFTRRYLATRSLVPAQASMVVFHIIYILRKVPLRKLTALTGWQATATETESAKVDLDYWMHTDRGSARRCLWHAACVYRDLHDRAKFECHEPLSITIASLYIAAFDALNEAAPLCNDIATVKSAPVRIDRMDQEYEINAWVESSENARIHLTGIGILTGERSANRLFAEIRKVLSSRQPWSRLCHGLAYMVGLTVKERQVRSFEYKSNDRLPYEEGPLHSE
ncbi:Transcription factor [Penicillium occitanis (nom. inval.)]|nr:Transcription factor [Penicillium occitanis (nom. inval.)]PCG93166.1 hypothetical protein PENOC_089060 [Penicillium occitanis (nom. inval.)]